MMFQKPLSRWFVQQLKERILKDRWCFTMRMGFTRRAWSILQGKEQ